jgi:hypothetical protein
MPKYVDGFVVPDKIMHARLDVGEAMLWLINGESADADAR